MDSVIFIVASVVVITTIIVLIAIPHTYVNSHAGKKFDKKPTKWTIWHPYRGPATIENPIWEHIIPKDLNLLTPIDRLKKLSWKLKKGGQYLDSEDGYFHIEITHRTTGRGKRYISINLRCYSSKDENWCNIDLQGDEYRQLREFVEIKLARETVEEKRTNRAKLLNCLEKAEGITRGPR